jgi:hypothetical protein
MFPLIDPSRKTEKTNFMLELVAFTSATLAQAQR